MASSRSAACPSSRSFCDKVKDALNSNDVNEIAKISENLKKRVPSTCEVAFQSLLESGKLHQYKLGPLDVKASVSLQLTSSKQRLLAFSSESSGNCLFSAMSIILAGDNSLSEDLRILSSMELFMYSSYYASHPVFNEVFAESQAQGQTFLNINSVFDLALSLKDNEYPYGTSLSKIVQYEAIKTCNSGTWVGLMSILALSTVVGRNINVFYPDCGAPSYKYLFGCQIHPRTEISSGDVNFLYIMHGIKVKAGEDYKSNHFVPCVFIKNNNLKRKSTSIVTKQKVKTPRLQAQAKIPFWADKFDNTFALPRIKNKKCKTPSQSVNFINSCAFIPTTSSHVCSNAASVENVSGKTFSSTAQFSAITTGLSSISVTPTSAFSAVNIFPTAQFKTTNLSNYSATPAQFSVTDSSSTVSSSATISTSVNSTSLNAATVNPFHTMSSLEQSDVCNYRSKVKSLSNNNTGIQELIKNVFKPDNKFVFPKTNGRNFRYNWLELFGWLCYSPSLDGAFCLPCVLFGDMFPTKVHKIRKLFSEPFSHWPDACAAFKRHENSKTGIHNECMAVYNNFLNNPLPIDVLIDSNRKKTIKQNRKKLVPIVDAIIVCGRQGLALRGHRDDAKYQPAPGEYSTEQTGNFVELLNFRIRGGDTFLEEHLLKCPKNATYISKTTQNELIDCCGNVVLNKIVSEIKKNKFFSISADELLDNSNKEQLSLVIRYVDSGYNIREDFLKFLHCESGLTGLDLSKLVLEALDDLKLPFQDCRGQAYDGAGNVAGHLSGLSARLIAINHKAIYVHCSSHRLNLCVAKSCSVTLVRNVMNKIKQLSYFFNYSQKRQQLLQKNVTEYCAEATKTKLKDVCRTRWVERIDGMEVFEELFLPLYVTLDDMSVNLNKICNHNTSSQALSFFNDIQTFEFIVSLVITRNVLSLTHGITALLQDRSIDIMDNINHIINLKNTVMNCRNQINFFHGTWYQQALDLAKKVGVEEKMKRVVRRQTLRDNHPSVSPKDYYKKVITIPILDHLINELDTRFDFSTVIVYDGLSVVPAKMISMINSNLDWKKTFKAFAKFYESDLPNPLALDADLLLWENYWLKSTSSPPETVAQTLKRVNMKMFPNLDVVLRILATIPVTSCECERSFSALRRLKDYSRSTMLEGRLNGLSLMYIHQEIVPDINEVLDLFAKDQRRLELI